MYVFTWFLYNAAMRVNPTQRLTSYLPRLFKKDIFTEPEVFFKNHLPEPRQFEWKIKKN